jgi:hypothetical protein
MFAQKVLSMQVPKNSIHSAHLSLAAGHGTRAMWVALALKTIDRWKSKSDQAAVICT